MKKHAIIPIFIPHRGCPHDCVFCNQHAITARTADVTPDDVRRIADEHLKTLANRGLETIELSFFGGSFTGLDIAEQSAFLAVAKEYKDKGKIDKIHLSTRPDYIDSDILDNLKRYGVDVIELGVQSMDENVLRLSERGHAVSDVYNACKLIKDYGFTLGVQLMIGLPGDSYEASVRSAKFTANELKPEIARLYPTVIISQTKLYDMYKSGEFVPFSEEEMLKTTLEMYKILTVAGINVIRIGLKSTALINDSEDSFAEGSYHPAFRQLVEGEIAKEELEEKLKAFSNNCSKDSFDLEISAGPERFSSLIGHNASNKKYFASKYPQFVIHYKEDPNIDGNEIIIKTIQ